MVDEVLIDDLTEQEWYESAENEPTEEDLWWARMLMDEGDEQC